MPQPEQQRVYLNSTLKTHNGKEVVFIATDETMDRSGESIPIESWDLNNYLKNPVLLVNHDYAVENVVGKATNLRIENRQLLFTPVFHRITQLSRDVDEMVQAGHLNTVSVGFMRKGAAVEGEMAKNELFEISIVPVPANPSAERIKEAMQKGVGADDLLKVKQWVEGKEQEPKAPENEEEEEETPQEKSGRVLSEKNRTAVKEAMDALATVKKLLQELLDATEPEKTAEAMKKVEPKVEQEDVSKRSLVRALQGINRSSNDLLRKLK